MTQAALVNEKWTIGRKISSILSIYFVFLILDFTSSDELFPHFVYEAMQFYTNFWKWLVPWTGQHILHLEKPITIFPGGSGDTTFNYVLQLLWIVFTLLITGIILVVDRKRPSYKQFNYWARIVMRYYLAYMLFVYGFIKVIKLQFPFPDLNRLTETYGESSPMGLAWTFVGYSAGYDLFIGGAEVLAGVLLFFKRTTLLGALLSITVMANVCAMNFAYDIPVKIFSANLLLLGCWIAWYDRERLLAVFILNHPVPESKEVPVATSPKKKGIQLVLKSVVIIFALYSTLWTDLATAKRYGDAAPKPPLYGIYDVESFERNHQVIIPLATDSTRWKRMILNYHGVVRVNNMLDSANWMGFKLDSLKGTARFINFADSTDFYQLNYTKRGEYLEWKGVIKKDSVNIRMKRVDHTQFPLVSRGFHWINEHSYNR
jgi:hypothetical protein